MRADEQGGGRFAGDDDLDGGLEGDGDAEALEAEAGTTWLDEYSDSRLLEVGSYQSAPGGIVYLVGAGPGDPGLLTVRARELIDRCDALVHDALVHPDLLRRSRLGVPPPELHFVGKRGGDEGSARQDDISALLVQLARQGKRIVRLKGGDPFVFGRGSEEAQALVEGGVAFEVVPGITSGIAAPAYAGIPVTHRSMATAVTFVTGHEAPGKASSQTDWGALARSGSTLVLYMGVKRLREIADALIAGGLPPEVPAAAIEWGTYPRQRTVVATLDTLATSMAREGIRAPVITVVGWTVVLRDEIRWFDQRPLFGLRVVVTRPEHGSTLAGMLRELGAEVIELPATRLERLDPQPLEEALQWLEQYEWVTFTSRNAVEFFWATLRASGRDARALASCKLAAVGPATSRALLAHGLAVDVEAERFVAEGVLAALEVRDDVTGARVLQVTAEGARPVLRDGLEAMGAVVDEVPLYRSVPDREARAPLRRLVEQGDADVVVFSSASTVKAYADAVGAEHVSRLPCVSIGSQTSTAARDAGLTVAAEAATATMESLVGALIEVAPSLRQRRSSNAHDAEQD